MIREGQWKLRRLTRKKGGELELYDILIDPSESNNFAAIHPNSAKRLSENSETWIDSLTKEYNKTYDKQD